MKRDMDLVREILLRIEAGQRYEEIPGYERDLVNYHRRLLVDAGYLTSGVMEVGKGRTFTIGIPQELTWAGHDFLDAARSDTVWNKAKERIASTGVSVTVEMLKRLLIKIAEGQLGL